MEKILNSIEELYKLITGTLPEGYVEHIPKVNWDMIGTDQYGAMDTRPICYFIIGVCSNKCKDIQICLNQQ